ARAGSREALGPSITRCSPPSSFTRRNASSPVRLAVTPITTTLKVLTVLGSHSGSGFFVLAFWACASAGQATTAMMHSTSATRFMFPSGFDERRDKSPGPCRFGQASTVLSYHGFDGPAPNTFRARARPAPLPSLGESGTIGPSTEEVRTWRAR